MAATCADISCMDWLLKRTVGTCMNSVIWFTIIFRFDFANNVTVFAKLFELLVPALETMASEATSLRLELNWQKTKSKPWTAGRMNINNQSSRVGGCSG